MKVKRTSKAWPKLIRNMIRMHRLSNYGWQCFGMIFTGSRMDFWVKRSNWIYNFSSNGAMFKGTK